jgi:hypothetical protein
MGKKKLKNEQGNFKEWMKMRIARECLSVKQRVTVFFLVLLHAESSWAQALRDVKPPVAYPSLWVFWLGILAGIGLLALIVWAFMRFWKSRRAKRSTETQQPVLPWQKAFGLLDALVKEELLAKGRIEEFYTRLSDILRHYLEEELGIRAPEMTTEEFLNFTKDHATLNNVQKNQLKAFLTDCDMVKFARYEPDAEKGRHSLSIVRELIQETKRTVESPQEAGNQAKGTVRS